MTRKTEIALLYYSTFWPCQIGLTNAFGNTDYEDKSDNLWPVWFLLCQQVKYIETSTQWGEHSLKMGYGYVQPSKPPFHTIPAIWKTPISAFYSSKEPIL